MIDLSKIKPKFKFTITPHMGTGVAISMAAIAAVTIGLAVFHFASDDAPKVAVAQAAPTPEVAASSVGFMKEGAPGCIDFTLDMRIEDAIKTCWGKPTTITEDARKQSDGSGGTQYIDEVTWTYKETGDRPDSHVTFCGGFLCVLVNHIDPDQYK